MKNFKILILLLGLFIANSDQVHIRLNSNLIKTLNKRQIENEISSESMIETGTREKEDTEFSTELISEFKTKAPEESLGEKNKDSGVESVTESVSETVTEPAAETVTEPIVEAVTESVAETVTEPIVEAVTESVAETVTEPIVEALTESVAETVTEPIVEAVTESVAETVTVPIVEAVTEPIVEALTESVSETVTEPAAETVTEPIVEALTESVSETVTEPAADTITEPIAETVTEPAADTVTEPIVEAVTEPAADTVTEPIAEAVTESVSETVTEPAADTITEPIAETVTEPAAEAVTKPISVSEPVAEVATESIADAVTSPIVITQTKSMSEPITEITTEQIYKETTEALAEDVAEKVEISTESIAEASVGDTSNETTDSDTVGYTKQIDDSFTEEKQDGETILVTNPISDQNNDQNKSKSNTKDSTKSYFESVSELGFTKSNEENSFGSEKVSTEHLTIDKEPINEDFDKDGDNQAVDEEFKEIEMTTTSSSTTSKSYVWFKPVAVPGYSDNSSDSFLDQTHMNENCPNLDCEFGFKTDLYGKPLCSCFNPCYEKKCGSNICKIEKLTETKYIGACYDPNQIERPIHCHLPLATGNCRDYTSRYYFNSFQQRCVHFVYTGCKGNGNNFPSWEKCHMECNTCSLPADKGPCHGNIIRYFYDSKRRECTPFSWGGCKGNDNNFSSRKHCEESCIFRKEGALFLNGMPLRVIRKYHGSNGQPVKKQ